MKLLFDVGTPGQETHKLQRQAGQLHYTQAGGNTIVQADVDGDGTADFEIELTGLLTLTAGDFLL